LRITNTFFKHKDIHKFTWSARNCSSLIDYVLVNKKTATLAEGTRFFAVHVLVAAKLAMSGRWRKKHSTKTREGKTFKVHLWKEESILNLYWLYSYNRPWRPVGLSDVEAPTFSIQSSNRWW
jgi:hypothetical protein